MDVTALQQTPGGMEMIVGILILLALLYGFVKLVSKAWHSEKD